MPKKRNFDPETLLNVLVNNKNAVYDENEKRFHIPSHPCWIEISKQMKGAITSKNAYTITTLNRYDCHQRMKIALDPIDSSETKFTSEISDEHNDSDTEDAEKDKLNFKIILSSDEWSSIILQNVMYRRTDEGDPSGTRSYDVLKDWTPLINDYFYAHTKTSCTLAFKRAKIMPQGTFFMKMEGNCSGCLSIFEAILYDTPEEGAKVILECSYEGSFKKCEPKRKRQVVGKQREEFVKQLTNENKSATYVRRIQAKKLMQFGDPEPSALPNLNTLRILKYKEGKKDNVHEDPILAIVLLKQCQPFSNIIKDIGYDRFFMHYWSTQELNMYRLYCRKNEAPKISIDASGNFIKPIKSSVGTNMKAVFLYEAVVVDAKSKTQYSVAHMLSERHDNNSISCWLSEWLKNDIPVPKIAVCDHSLALMMGIVKSFTQYSTLNQYLKICSLLVIEKIYNALLPTCMLRNDFNHTMHLITSWPELKNHSTKRVKNFYFRAIGLVIISQDFDDIKILLKNIFTIALDEECGTNNETSLRNPCQEAKDYLTRRIAFHGEDWLTTEIEEEVDDPKIPDNYTSNDESENDIFLQIRVIYNECLNDSETEEHKGDDINALHNPAIAKRLVNFCQRICCWSAVMVPIFGYSNETESSAGAEGIFNDIKNRVFKHQKLPQRLEKFVTTHVNSTLGAMNIVRAKMDVKNTIAHPKKENSPLPPSDEEDDVDPIKNVDTKSQIENENENWRGLGNPKNKTPKDNYTKPDTSVLHQNIDSKSKSQVIGILRNANLPNLKSICFEGKYYTLSNTCAFDSITQMMCTSYADSAQYAEYVNSKSQSSKLCELISHALRDGINSQAYRKRAEILLSIFKKVKLHQVNHFSVDAACTAYRLLGDLLNEFPSVRERNSCNSCNHVNVIPIPVIVANFLSNSLVDLQSVLDARFSNERCCRKCSEIVEIQFDVGKHVFIELCPQSKANIEYMSFPLNQIPKMLKILGKVYKLRGVLSFIPPPSKSVAAVGHYIAYCYRIGTDQWEKHDDLTIKIKPVRNNVLASNCQFVLYTI